MAAYKLQDFQDIYRAIAEELKIQLTDTTNINRIKRAINMHYIDEIAPRARWWWLQGHTEVRHKPVYSAGTCAITPNTTTVTLSVAPAVTVGESGSFKNYLFSIDGQNEVYRISAHTALATTLTLSTPFNGALVSAATFKIWSDEVALPTDCRETVELWHDHMQHPMEPRGIQDFRRLVAGSPKTAGRPVYYATYDFRDPSENDGETESDRYRLLKVYPSISNYTTIIKLDYIKDITALESDGDEPLMPVEDRISIYYAALSTLWVSIGRNPEEAARNKSLYEDKLARMLGKVTDSMDKPKIQPESTYVSAKRGPRLSSMSRRGLSAGGGGQGTFNAPNYLENVTINGGVLTGNLTVNPSITVDGRDISADGLALDSHIADTSVHGVSGDVVGTTDIQTLTNKTIDADLNTISNIADANVKTGAAIARSKLASGNVNRIIINDGSGVMSESAVTSTELLYLDDVEGLSSVTLTDNTTAPTACYSVAVTTAEVVNLEYTITRGSANIESGLIKLVTDGTSAAIAQGAIASLGTIGVTFTTDVSGGNLRLLYTTTSTGTNADLKFKLHKWLA